MIKHGEVGEVYLVHGNYLQDWLYYKTDFNWRLESDLGGQSRAINRYRFALCDMAQFLTDQKSKSFADLVTIHKTRIKPNKAAETFKGKEIKSAAGKKFDKNRRCRISPYSIENGAKGVFTVSQVSAGRKIISG